MTLSEVLARAAFDTGSPAAEKQFVPTSTFAKHRAAIVDLVVQSPERVLSVDEDRVALLWNARSGAFIAGYELPAAAILRSIFITDQALLAYVAYRGDVLSVCALDTHRDLAQVTAPALGRITMAIGAPDLSRVVLAANEDLVMVPLAAGEAPLRIEVARHEPKIETMHAMTESGFAVYVHYSHLAGDTIHGEESKVFDGSTLAELRFRATYDPLPSTSPLAGARVTSGGRVARVTLADGIVLPDLVAHEQPICHTCWIVDDAALLTADRGGTVHRWDGLAAVPRSPQHLGAVTMVRFTRDGVVSSTDQQVRIWRDGRFVASVPAEPFGRFVVDSEADRLVSVTQHQLRTYALQDGTLRATHDVPATVTSFRPAHGAHARVSVGFDHAYPVRIVSLRDKTERMVPFGWSEIMNERDGAVVVGDLAGAVTLLQ